MSNIFFSNIIIIMLKKNFKVVSHVGGLSGSEVNDLYKIYTSMDGKHKKFKGSKEEYITAVSELIKKFVDSSMGDSTHLMGGVKLAEILNRNKLEKELLTKKEAQVKAISDKQRKNTEVEENKRLFDEQTVKTKEAVKKIAEEIQALVDSNIISQKSQTKLQAKINNYNKKVQSSKSLDKIKKYADKLTKYTEALSKISEKIEEDKQTLERITQTKEATKKHRSEYLDKFATAKTKIAEDITSIETILKNLDSDITKNTQAISEIETKIAERDAVKQAKAREIVESEFVEGEKLFDKKTRYTEGTLPQQDESGVYSESELTHVINPFYISPEGGDVPSFVGTPSEKYRQLVEYTAKYYAFVKTIITSALPENTKAGHAPTPVNRTMLRNFLIAAPFQYLTELSPRGRRQREEFASHLTSLGRKTLVGTTKMGWTETEEGSYRSEQFVYWGYLARSEMNPIKRTCKQFELLGKIFSLETANERVDYNFKLYTGESKGRKTLDGVFLQKGTKRPQIDLDKIISIIAHAATIDTDGKVHYNYPNALFTLYKSDMQLVKYDETKPLVGEVRSKMSKKLPFEVILRLNLLKVIEAAKDVTIPSLARGPAIVDGAPSKKELALQEQDPEYTPKAKKRLEYTIPPQKVGTVKKQIPLLEELDIIIKDYHQLRKESKPKFAGKLLSFEKNKDRISKIATALLHNFFIESAFKVVAPSIETLKEKYDAAKTTAKTLAARKIFAAKQTYFKPDFRPTGITELKSVFLSKKKFEKFLKDNDTTMEAVFKKGYTQDTLIEIREKAVDDYLVEQNIAVPESKRSLFSAGDLYSGKLVDLDISQPYIAKHIEVVGYSKSLFTVNGKLQEATALNYSKFFVKGAGADPMWLERYQDFTGDTLNNYKFDKIDIEAPIIESHGEFEPIEDVTLSKKKSLREDYNTLDDEQKLTVINEMIQYIEGNDKSAYSKLPSDYEQNKLLNFFITRYPHDTEKFISAIFGGPDEEELFDAMHIHGDANSDEEDDGRGVSESKGGDDSEEGSDDDKSKLKAKGGDDSEEGSDDDKSKLKAKGKPTTRKPKAYHKKVIKYY